MAGTTPKQWALPGGKLSNRSATHHTDHAHSAYRSWTRDLDGPLDEMCMARHGGL